MSGVITVAGRTNVISNLNNYIHDLVSYRALKKRKMVMNQLLRLIGSRRRTKRRKLLGADYLRRRYVDRIESFINSFFFINFLYNKARLVLRTTPSRIVTSHLLNLSNFLYLRKITQKLHKRLFSKKKLKINLSKIRYYFNKKFIDLFGVYNLYLKDSKEYIEYYKYADKFSNKITKAAEARGVDYDEDFSLNEAFYKGKYRFKTNVKSKRVARFLAKIAYVFKRRRRSVYYYILRPYRFPFRIGTKRTNFYLEHRPNLKTASYNDYRSLKIFFGGLKPEVFWKGSREAVKKDAGTWSFLKKYSYLDFRLDYFLSRIGFVDNIFEGKNLVEGRKIMVSSRVVQTSNLPVRPYEWIEVVGDERLNFKLNYLSKLVVQRTQDYKLKAIPNFVEVNWALFRFFILPIITLSDMVRPYASSNFHVGGGKKQPAKLG